jgi:hypothetical protein
MRAADRWVRGADAPGWATVAFECSLAQSARFWAVCVAWSGFRQSGVVPSRLVVDWRSRVETHQRVTRAVGRLRTI